MQLLPLKINLLMSQTKHVITLTDGKKMFSIFRDFFAILGMGPRAFQIGKISGVNP